MYFLTLPSSSASKAFSMRCPKASDSLETCDSEIFPSSLTVLQMSLSTSASCAFFIEAALIWLRFFQQSTCPVFCTLLVWLGSAYTIQLVQAQLYSCQIGSSTLQGRASELRRSTRKNRRLRLSYHSVERWLLPLLQASVLWVWSCHGCKLVRQRLWRLLEPVLQVLRNILCLLRRLLRIWRLPPQLQPFFPCCLCGYHIL